MIVFKQTRTTKGFIVYKTDDAMHIGDFTQIYVKHTSKLSDEEELVLISKQEYNDLKEENPIRLQVRGMMC